MSTLSATVPSVHYLSPGGSLWGVMRSEFRKFLSTRLWWIMAVTFAGYMVFLAAMMAFAFSADTNASVEGPEGTLAAAGQDIADAVYSLAPTMGYVFPLIVGAIGVSAEFRHQTITPTLLAEPRRTRLVIAKLLSIIPIGAVMGLIGTIAAWATGAGVLALTGTETFAFSTETLELLARSVVALTIWAMVGVGFGMALTNQVVSIVVVLGFTQFVEPILRTLLATNDDLAPVSKFLPGAAGEAIAGGSMYNLMTPTGTLDGWQGALVLAAYGIVFAVLGRLTTFRRDIG